MKRGRLLIFLILLVVALIWWLSRLSQPLEVKEMQIKKELAKPAPPKTSENVKERKAPVEANEETKSAIATNAPLQKKIGREWQLEQLEKANEKWKTPLRFYGKVVDENNNPVEGAVAHFSWTDLSPSGSSQTDVRSGVDGLFSLEGVTGYNMGVILKKEGYYTSWEKNRRSFQFAEEGDPYSYEPDPANPIIFYLRKKGEAEPLVHLRKGFKIPKDGTPVEVDLVKGEVVAEGKGHLKVQCWTDPQQQDEKGRYKREYHWRCLMSVPNGGIAAQKGEFDFAAPESGYNPSLEIDMPQEIERWTNDVSQKIFIKAVNGQIYARGTFNMIAGGDHFFRLEMDVNPSGSRNLEFDESKQINKEE